MVQLWVNLPAQDKSAAPGYQNVTWDLICAITDAQAEICLITGDYAGTAGHARTVTPFKV